MIALAKKEPGQAPAGTPPAPTINYFAAKLFNLMGGVDITIAPKRHRSADHRSARRSRAARFQHHPRFSEPDRSPDNCAASRWPPPPRSVALPNVPTAAESGLPGFEAVQYYGVTAPAGVPRPIVDRLNKALRADVDLGLYQETAPSPPVAIRAIRRRMAMRRISSARKASGPRSSRSSA